MVLKRTPRNHNPPIGITLVSVCTASAALKCSAAAYIMQGMIDRRLSEYFAAMGRKSAKVRMKTVSARRRKQIARNAAKARWAKRKRKG